MNKFKLYRTFVDSIQALDFVQLLKDNGINSKISEISSPLDSSFGSGTYNSQYEILILQVDFEKADKILETIAEKSIDTIDPDHYLYEFSNDELLNIQKNPDEWNEIDRVLSARILKDRLSNPDKFITNEILDHNPDSTKKLVNQKEKNTELNKFNELLNKYLTSVIIILIGSYLAFFTSEYEPENETNTNKIVGIIKVPPSEGEGDAIGKYISLQLRNHNDRYQFSGCSYSKQIRERVLKLKAGDSITIVSSINSSSTTYPWSGSKYENFRICAATTTEKIIDIDDFNSCSYRQATTIYPKLGIIFILFGVGLSIKNAWFDF